MWSQKLDLPQFLRYRVKITYLTVSSRESTSGRSINLERGGAPERGMGAPSKQKQNVKVSKCTCIMTIFMNGRIFVNLISFWRVYEIKMTHHWNFENFDLYSIYLTFDGTWSYLRICQRSVLPYTQFCNCL
jgi:hypothetical protein